MARRGLCRCAAGSPELRVRALRSYDWADGELRGAIDDVVRRWYLADADYPAHYEPSGSDFLSPALAEAELLSRVLPPDEFADPSDGQLAHLAGLNFSRAWSMLAIASALPAASPVAAALTASAELHAEAGLPVVGGDYMVEHWLAAYAVGYLTA